jgi:hypothetical protein
VGSNEGDVNYIPNGHKRRSLKGCNMAEQRLELILFTSKHQNIFPDKNSTIPTKVNDDDDDDSSSSKGV